MDISLRLPISFAYNKGPHYKRKDNSVSHCFASLINGSQVNLSSQQIMQGD